MAGVLTGLCLYMVEIGSTVEKQAKNMPDNIVETIKMPKKDFSGLSLKFVSCSPLTRLKMSARLNIKLSKQGY